MDRQTEEGRKKKGGEGRREEGRLPLRGFTPASARLRSRHAQKPMPQWCHVSQKDPFRLHNKATQGPVGGWGWNMVSFPNWGRF